MTHPNLPVWFLHEKRFLQDRGTYHEVYNEQLLPKSDLAPFRTENGSYWTSDEARLLDQDPKAFNKCKR